MAAFAPVRLVLGLGIFEFTRGDRYGASDSVSGSLLSLRASRHINSFCCILHQSISLAWMKGQGVILSVPVAVFLGLVAACFSNNDTVHRLFRWLGITRETSYPSEWYSSFARSDCYVVLHLTGKRHLFGWPEEWPSRPEEGHFRITEGEWFIETETDGEYQKKMPATEISAILIPVGEVEMVEFVSASPDEETKE